MSGWERPTPPDSADPDQRPGTFWAQPPPSDALGPGQLIRRAWRLYRATPRRFLLAAAGPELLRDLLAIPSLLIAFGFVESMVAVFGEYLAEIAANPAAYRADPSVLQTQLEDRLRVVLVPAPDLAAISTTTGAAGVVISLVGTAVLTALALAVARGQVLSVVDAFRLVVARGALMKPIVALGAGWLVVSVVPMLLQSSPDFQAWAGVPGSPRSVLIGSLLSVLGVVVAVLIVVVAVRWALYVAVVVAEPIGVRPALARSAELSRGIRTRIGLAMAGVLLMHALSVGVVAGLLGIATGLSTDSVAVGFGAYLAASIVGNLLWAPLLPSMLALAYHSRVGEVPTVSPS